MRASELKVNGEPIRLMGAAGLGIRRIHVMGVPHSLCGKEEFV